MYNTYKGRFTPKHPEKYAGNPNLIVFRSLWERKAMVFFDTHSDVLRWASEEIAIPYVSPADLRSHRYFPDFWARVRKPDGEVIDYLIEVKPKAQTVPPIPRGNRRTRRYIQEVLTYGVNEAKWQAALGLCRKRGWQFMILTEDELG